MWYDAQRTGVEAVKAVFSIAVLWGGMFVSGAADRSVEPSFGATAANDIVGVWEWVLEASSRRPGAESAMASLLEIRRDDAGRLSARVLLDDAGRPIVGSPNSFLVGGPTGPQFDRLEEGELERARAWGAELASMLPAPVAGTS